MQEELYEALFSDVQPLFTKSKKGDDFEVIKVTTGEHRYYFKVKAKSIYQAYYIAMQKMHELCNVQFQVHYIRKWKKMI